MSINKEIKDVVFIGDKINKSTFRNNQPTGVYYPKQIWTSITDVSIPGVQPWYLIGSCGQVYSKLYKCFLKTSIINSGYVRIQLRSRSNEKLDALVHRVMMMEFCPVPNMENLVPNHKDNIRTNNFLYNLEWVTYSENNLYMYKNGNGKVGSENVLCTKYNEEIIKKICECLEKDLDVHEIAKACNIKFDESVRATIKQVAKGNNWKSVSNDYDLSKSRYYKNKY